MRGERVPQRVRADPHLRARAADVAPHEPVDAARGQAAAAVVEKERVAGGPPAPRPVRPGRGRPQRAPILQIAAHRRGRRPVERQHALLAALPAHAQHPAAQIDVFEVQTDQLAQAQTRRVEQLQHGAVAPAERRRGVGRPEQLLHLDRVEMRRHLALDARGGDQRSRILRQVPGPAQIAAERADGGQPPRRRRARVAAAMQLAEEGPDAAVVEIGRTHRARPRRGPRGTPAAARDRSGRPPRCGARRSGCSADGRGTTRVALS